MSRPPAISSRVFWKRMDSFRRPRDSRCVASRLPLTALLPPMKATETTRATRMPEGDTIFRAARTLNRALAGQVVTKFETQLPQLARVDHDTPVAGRTIELVDAEGKWMRMYFSGDLILVTHMRMSGSWHIYRPGEKWQRGRIQMRVAI